MYAQKVEGASWRGLKLEEGKVQKMSGKQVSKEPGIIADGVPSDQQIGQLYELMQAIKNKGEPGEGGDGDPKISG